MEKKNQKKTTKQKTKLLVIPKTFLDIFFCNFLKPETCHVNGPGPFLVFSATVIGKVSRTSTSKTDSRM